MHSNGTSPYPRGTETILLVEPEPETRVLAAFMLTRQGYRVLEARCAADAVGIYDATQDRVDLLCTEALMNRINGHELAEKLCSVNPQMKVLYLADADYERLTRRVAAQKGLTFLVRPFTMSSLAAKVRQALDSGAPVRRAAAGYGQSGIPRA